MTSVLLVDELSAALCSFPLHMEECLLSNTCHHLICSAKYFSIPQGWFKGIEVQGSSIYDVGWDLVESVIRLKHTVQIMPYLICNIFSLYKLWKD